MDTLAQWRKRRPTKNAAGMNYTARRQRRKGRTLGEPDPINTICVRGTLDTLGGFYMCRQHTVCPCCRSKTGPYVLNDRGRKRLARIKRKRQGQMSDIVRSFNDAQWAKP